MEFERGNQRLYLISAISYFDVFGFSFKKERMFDIF